MIKNIINKRYSITINWKLCFHLCPESYTGDFDGYMCLHIFAFPGMANQDELRSQLEALHIENAGHLTVLPETIPSINRVAVKLPLFWAE